MKELKFKPDLLVPFDAKGNQLGHDYNVDSWEKNETFTAELVFEKFLQGRSSVKAKFKDPLNEKTYEMFFTDFELLVKNELLYYGEFVDCFHFEKRGANWGIVPHLGRELNA